LEAGLALLADNPRIGVPCDQLRSGYWRFPIKHHVVYYRLAADRIDIIRVLNEDMDPESRL
jgi:toxin ParE1/3/4